MDQMNFESDGMERCATIYRRCSESNAATFAYVCFQCGLTFDTIDCTLKHNETHFQSAEATIDETNIKQERIDDIHIASQPEMIDIKTVIKQEEDYDIEDIVDSDSVDPMDAFEEATDELYSNNSETDTSIAEAGMLKHKAEANEVLPRRTKSSYILAYNTFKKWQTLKKAPDISETVLLAYFHDLTKRYKPSSLWAIFSMLKATIQENDNIDIGVYRQVTAFIKTKSTGYRPAQAKVFNEQEIHKFIDEAPDKDWLDVKVVCIFGVCGGCKSHELPRIKLEDIENHGDLLLVRIHQTRAKGVRSFTITGEFYTIVQKYAVLRPPSTNATTTRFFVNYQRGKCTTQVIGKNKFSQMPRRIAKYLSLPEPESYTGNSFRRTSASLLANIGANMLTIKRHCLLNEVPKQEEVEVEETVTLPATQHPPSPEFLSLQSTMTM